MNDENSIRYQIIYTKLFQWFNEDINLFDIFIDGSKFFF